MICSICHETFSYATESEPAELCWCGEMAVGSVWAWDRWRGLRKAFRYRLAGIFSYWIELLVVEDKRV